MPATTIPVAPRLATAARSERCRSASPTATTTATAATTVAERIQARKDRVIRELGLPKLKGMFGLFLWSLLPFAFGLLPTLSAFGFAGRAFLFSCLSRCFFASLLLCILALYLTVDRSFLLLVCIFGPRCRGPCCHRLF